MLIGDVVNLWAEKWIEDFNKKGKPLTIWDIRSIIYSSVTEYRIGNAKEYELTRFTMHPSVQIRGVGMNGNVMDEFIKEAKWEKDFWEKNIWKEIRKKENPEK